MSVAEMMHRHASQGMLMAMVAHDTRRNSERTLLAEHRKGLANSALDAESRVRYHANELIRLCEREVG